VIPLVIAMFLPNVRPAMGISGALGGCLVDFVFPAVLFIKNSKHGLMHYQNVLCIIFAVFGLAAALISTYQAIIDAISAFGSGQ
jgi:hypothetical protein